MNNLYLELEKRNILDRVCVLGENYIILSRIDDPSGEALLLESFSECGKMLFISREGTRTLQKFVVGRDNPPCAAPTVEEALDKGADILADIARTRPLSTPSVTGILPSFDEGAYIALGHPSAVASVTVDRLGRIYDQSRFYDRDNFPSEKIIFSPSEADTEKPRQSLLDGLYPVLFSRFSNTEYAYFIERGDLRLSPAVWVRTVRLDGERIANITYERILCDSISVL